MYKKLAFDWRRIYVKVRFYLFDSKGFSKINCIALYNPKYDEDLIKRRENLETHYSKEYLKYWENRKIQYGNNFVLNFYIDDLNAEYERIKNLNIGKMTGIMYLNISSPYYHFLLEDPDGNVIEITRQYDE